MKYEKIDRYLEEHMQELLQDLDVLVSINSEKTEALPGMPFGKGNADCSAAAEKIARKCGMAVTNYDNYVVTADMDPQSPQGVDILAHLDVVPAGEGWQVTTPFEMKVLDGKVYGRGTADDKGPALCALYAMRAIKELGLPLRKNVRLILGSDEECGSSDLKYYFQKETSAPFSLSPDADFPMINIEKGGLRAGFSSQAAVAAETPRVLSFASGVKTNVIPDKALAEVEGLEAAAIQSAADALPNMEGITFSCREENGVVTVEARGLTGHAAHPQSAHNALTALLALLAALPLSPAPIHDQFKAVSTLFPHGDCYGGGLGVDMEDEVSGKTVLSLTICSFSAQDGFTGTFDCRACLSANDSNTTEVISGKFRDAGLEPIGKQKMFAPHIVPEDSELVQTLLDVYEDMTGKRPKPLCIGGGTYVHHIENGVAFGCGLEGVDNKIHSADEFMTLEQIIFSCKIYARAILALCGE